MHESPCGDDPTAVGRESACCLCVCVDAPVQMLCVNACELRVCVRACVSVLPSCRNGNGNLAILLVSACVSALPCATSTTELIRIARVSVLSALPYATAATDLARIARVCVHVCAFLRDGCYGTCPYCSYLSVSLAAHSSFFCHGSRS